MPGSFGITVARKPNHVEVAPRGEIDLAVAGELRECLLELLAGGDDRIVVDLEGVEFLDSTGLGVLVGGLKRARERGGDLQVRDPRPQVRSVFEITGLAPVFGLDENG